MSSLLIVILVIIGLVIVVFCLSHRFRERLFDIIDDLIEAVIDIFD
jgi:hypothetical protein